MYKKSKRVNKRSAIVEYWTKVKSCE